MSDTKTTRNDVEHEHTTGTGTTRKTVLESHGYVLGHTVGTGTYATVKIVSKFSAPTDYLRKFLPREIEVVKGLKHTNLIRFLQAIETTHRVYIIMEYAENGSLLDIIRHDTYIDEVRARKWFSQLVRALYYCHEKNVVHSDTFYDHPPYVWCRDIKCENMLMDADYNLKLSDFGFARSQLKNSKGQYNLSDTFCGSYAYASPEILKGIPYQPHLSDVWSCGVVLYAMVFGRLPFDDSNFATLLKQVSSRVVFPREPKVSGQCKVLISKILVPLKERITLATIITDPFCIVPPAISSHDKEEATCSNTDHPLTSITAQASSKTQKNDEPSEDKDKTVSKVGTKSKNINSDSL